MPQKALALARTQTGKPYVWGGKNGFPGWDCSGLPGWAYQQVGGKVSLWYTDTMAAETDRIDERDAVAGDLLFYRYYDSEQEGTVFPHMAMWLPNGRSYEARWPDGCYEYDRLDVEYEIHRVRR